MNAAEAKLRTKNAKERIEANAEIQIRVGMVPNAEIQIRAVVNNVLKQIKNAANNGQDYIVFGVEGLRSLEDVNEVKSRLKALGYEFSNECENGYAYEAISW